MNQHFEIVRSNDDRYSWRFVGHKGRKRRRRVLARSARTYRSPEKVLGAIEKLQAAECIDATEESYPLPASSFAFVSGALPLPVKGHPGEDDSRDDVRYRTATAAKAETKPAAAKQRATKPAARKSAAVKKAT